MFLGRQKIDVAYSGSDDVFDIAVKYAASIALSHTRPDADKRTGLALAFESLPFNDSEIAADNALFADVITDVVIGKMNESGFADLLYPQYIFEQNSGIQNLSSPRVVVDQIMLIFTILRVLQEGDDWFIT